MADTTYNIFYGAENGWESLGLAEGRSANEAIRTRLNTLEQAPAGKYVAVPARSWKPVTVTTETKTILKLEQPDPAA
jgi:hypothetical protein